MKIQTAPEEAKASIETVGLSFLFAQSYHGSMKYVGPARKEMGLRTVFNILGPLTNPASTNYIVLGVYEKALLPVMAQVLIGLGIKRAMIVYGNDRLDEISVSDSTSVAEVRDGKVKEYEIAPEDFGLPRGSKEDIMSFFPECLHHPWNSGRLHSGCQAEYRSAQRRLCPVYHRKGREHCGRRGTGSRADRQRKGAGKAERVCGIYQSTGLRRGAYDSG